jgi:hypothetical protein
MFGLFARQICAFSAEAEILPGFNFDAFAAHDHPLRDSSSEAFPVIMGRRQTVGGSVMSVELKYVRIELRDKRGLVVGLIRKCDLASRISEKDLCEAIENALRSLASELPCLGASSDDSLGDCGDGAEDWLCCEVPNFCGIFRPGAIKRSRVASLRADPVWKYPYRGPQ